MVSQEDFNRATSATAPDYVLIGHFTRDLTAHGERLGGTVLYSAVTATRLGRRVGIVTAFGPALVLPQALLGAQLTMVATDITTTFVHGKDASGQRTLQLRARAPNISVADVPLTWRTAPIIQLAPVAQELNVADMVEALHPALLAATLQGWLRQVDADGSIEPDPAALEHLPLGALGAAVLSIEDVGGDNIAVGKAATAVPLLVMTRGAQGCTLYLDGAPFDVPACPAQERDSVGAGDVFATALFIRLAETQDPLESARFAACAAAYAIEGVGWEATPDRAQVEARLRATRGH